LQSEGYLDFSYILRRRLEGILIVVCAVLAPLGDLAQDQPITTISTRAYLNSELTIDQRVDDLVPRMTLEEKASQVVHKAAAIPRLNVPAYNWSNEALHGVANSIATIFPEPIGLAATFDAALV
jgi:beta-glucosidase